ncbi:MAG: hypothetical protein SFW64_00655 [Alphaproteobacteria bacterium]|nr:hypothetical protein [Alphaproteobacteria bacterium]
MRYSNHLERSRHNVFYFRYPLPSLLHRAGKSKHVKVSLHDVEAQHPDEFIAHLIDLAPTAVLEAAKRVRARLQNPPKTVTEYLDILAKQGLPKTVDFLSGALALI